MVNSGATRNKMSAKIAISAISPPVGGLLASIASRRGPTCLREKPTDELSSEGAGETGSLLRNFFL